MMFEIAKFPYETIAMDVYDELDDLPVGVLSPYLATIMVGESVVSDVLYWDGDTGEYAWLDGDWWGGEEEVKLLGAIYLGDVFVDGFPQKESDIWTILFSKETSTIHRWQDRLQELKNK